MSKHADVMSILQRSNFRPRNGTENISIPCPLAPYTPLHRNSVDSRPSMGIKVTDTAVLVHCFTCGFKSGQLSYLYSRLAHYDQSWQPALEAVRHMESQYLSAGLSALQSIGYMRQAQAQDKPLDEDLFRPYANMFAPYLGRRGVSIETGKRWGVGVDLERKRAVIPVRDTRGLLWGAVGRSYVDEKPKYLNYWEMRKGKHLLGAHLVKRAASTLVVEGSIDALIADQALRDAGRDDINVVSVLGATISQEQAQKIVAISTDVYLALDADQAGDRGTKRALDLLSKRVMTRVCLIGQTGAKDFGSCSPDEILSVIDNAVLN